MDIITESITEIEGIRLSIKEGGIEVGRARLYIMKNDVHNTPFGLLEYVLVDEAHQNKGYGGALVKKIIALAKEKGCYKLICTSRYGKEKVHNWYIKYGFKEWGKEFRIDL